MQICQEFITSSLGLFCDVDGHSPQHPHPEPCFSKTAVSKGICKGFSTHEVLAGLGEVSVGFTIAGEEFTQQWDDISEVKPD